MLLENRVKKLEGKLKPLNYEALKVLCFASPTELNEVPYKQLAEKYKNETFIPYETKERTMFEIRRIASVNLFFNDVNEEVKKFYKKKVITLSALEIIHGYDVLE